MYKKKFSWNRENLRDTHLESFSTLFGDSILVSWEGRNNVEDFPMMIRGT